MATPDRFQQLEAEYFVLRGKFVAGRITSAEFSAALKIEDDEPLLLWLGQLYLAVNDVKLDERRAVQDRFKSIISVFWKAVFAEFKQRPKFEFKPQKQLRIRLGSAPGQSSRLSEDAEITLLGNAHTVFGIFNQSSSLTLSGKEFCRELGKADGSLGTFWTGTLVRILAKAGIADGQDEVGNLIWSHTEQKLYRLILTTYTTYHNGTIQASIYIVEVFKRKDHGDL